MKLNFEIKKTENLEIHFWNKLFSIRHTELVEEYPLYPEPVIMMKQL